MQGVEPSIEKNLGMRIFWELRSVDRFPLVLDIHATKTASNVIAFPSAEGGEGSEKKSGGAHWREEGREDKGPGQIALSSRAGERSILGVSILNYVLHYRKIFCPLSSNKGHFISSLLRRQESH